jgi:hypothetical protein
MVKSQEINVIFPLLDDLCGKRALSLSVLELFLKNVIIVVNCSSKMKEETSMEQTIFLIFMKN